MKKLAILLFFWHCYMLQAQELAFDKVLHSIGNNSVSSKAIATDKQSNIYLLGQFSGEASIEANTLNAAGKTDVFLAKFDNECQLVWIKQINGPGYITPHSIELDNDNNIYISGTFGNTVNFGGKSLKANSYQDNFIAKYNNNGDILWINHIHANTKAYKTLLAAGNNGQLYFAGSFVKTIQIDDTELKAQNNADIFIAELDLDGNFKQAAQITGQQEEQLLDIKCSASGDLFLTGSFTKDISFANASFESNGEEDIFIAKYRGLDFEWAKTMGSPYKDYGSVILLKDNNLILGGSFSGELTVEKTSLKSSGVLDVFICSYNLDGQLNRANKFGGNANEYLNTLAMNNNGQLYLSGNFRGQINKGKSKIKSDGLINDIFLAKYNEKGEFVWTKNYGGKGSDYAVALLQTKDNYLYLAGEFEDKITFENKEIAADGRSNFFISRFYDCQLNKKIDLGLDKVGCGAEYLLKAEDGFVSYLWSNGAIEQQVMVNAAGNYSVTATDSMGCQSSDEVLLTLNPLPVPELPASVNLCPNSSVRLDAGAGFENYLWGNGDKTRKITVLEPGVYTVLVSNEFNCESTATVSVELLPKAAFGLGDDIKIGQGSELILTPGTDFQSYLWSDNSSQPSLNINTSGLNLGMHEYWVEATDSFSCLYNDTIQIEILAPVDNNPSLANVQAEISPNPSNGIFRLKLSNILAGAKIGFKIYNTGGILLKLIEGEKSTSKYYQHDFNLSSLAKGGYLLKVLVGDQLVSKEIIIQ